MSESEAKVVKHELDANWTLHLASIDFMETTTILRYTDSQGKWRPVGVLSECNGYVTFLHQVNKPSGDQYDEVEYGDLPKSYEEWQDYDHSPLGGEIPWEIMKDAWEIMMGWRGEYNEAEGEGKPNPYSNLAWG